MPSIGIEDCLQVQKHPQKCPSASEAVLRRQEEKKYCLWSTVQKLWVCVHRGNQKEPWEAPKRAQECSEETQHQQLDCSPCLDQPTPSGLEGCQDKRNGRELLGEKSTGSPVHYPTAARLQLGLWSGNQSFLATTAWQTHMLLTNFKRIHYLIPSSDLCHFTLFIYLPTI